MIYSDKFEAKKEKVNSLCKQLLDKEDKLILEILYDVANVQEVQKGKNLQERLSKTPYSDLSVKQLLDTFTKRKFNELSHYKKALLFQELHNRECKNYKFEPRYIVSLKGSESATYNGYMMPGTNELNLNGYMIRKLSSGEVSNIYGRTPENVGIHFAYTLIHETQHCHQMEKIMDFAIGNDKNEEQNAKSAIFLMNLAVGEYAERNNDKNLQDFIRKAYWYDYMEHCSNMAPVKFMKKAIKNNDVMNMDFYRAMSQRTKSDIHVYDSTIKERISDMEYVIQVYLKVFDEKIADGEIKRKVVDILNDFTKVDENGDSKLRKSLKKDFDMARKMIDYCDTIVKAKAIINCPTE